MLFFLVLIAAIAEMISIGALLPFLSLLSSPDKVYGHSLVQPFIQLFEINDSNQLLLLFTLLFILAALLSGVIRLVLLWAQVRLAAAVGADISADIYKKTLYQPYKIHVMRNSSEIIAGISGKANAVVNNVVMPMINIISSVFMLFTIMLLLVYIDPMIALSTFAGFGAIYLVVTFFVKKLLSRCGVQVNCMQNNVIKSLQEGLGGIRDVLIDGTQPAYCQVYQRANLPLRRALANINIISESPRYAIETLGIVLIALLALVMSDHHEGIISAIPILGTLALGAQKILPILQKIYVSWTSMEGGQAMVYDALDLLEQPMPKHVNDKSNEPILFKHSLVLNNVSFRYTDVSPWVLKEINVKINKGSHIGFIGTTGSGKSTLIDVIMNLLQPTKGSICLDELLLNQKNQRAWQKHIAHVPQSIFLSDTTIAENIALGSPKDEIDYERVYESAKKAQLLETIDALDDKYDTLVGERGVRLSGGQRQRIGIARALYKQADVIVLDEATSALDNKTEQLVMNAINSIDDDITVLIVAHRLTTLENCDLLIELSEGEVIRSGAYSEIVNDNSE